MYKKHTKKLDFWFFLAKFFWANHSFHLSWATWANQLRSLICLEGSERIAYSCSFDLSKMSEWANEKMSDERMSKLPALVLSLLSLINILWWCPTAWSKLNLQNRKWLNNVFFLYHCTITSKFAWFSLTFFACFLISLTGPELSSAPTGYGTPTGRDQTGFLTLLMLFLLGFSRSWSICNCD